MTLLLDRRSLLAVAGASTLFPAAALAEAIPAPDREEMVPVEGGRIYVRINGRIRAERPPLVMIHGGPGSSHGGFLPALALADDRAVILYDQLDSGRSDRPMDPGNWRVPRFVNEVDAIRRALRLDRVHVYGASWGGTVALEYAARRPAGLASTILQSPLISTRAWLADANLLRGMLPPATQATLRRCERSRRRPGPECSAADALFYQRHVRRVPRPPEVQRYIDALPMPFNSQVYQTMWGRTEFVSTGTLSTYDGEPLLAHLDGPRTFFVAGQYDEARPATVGEFARRVAGAEFAVLPGAAHGILTDNPEPLLYLLERWLTRHDAS